MTKEVVIINGARTATGSFQGLLSSLDASDLGAEVIKEAIIRSGIQPSDINEVIMGCVLSLLA